MLLFNLPKNSCFVPFFMDMDIEVQKGLSYFFKIMQVSD